MYKFNAIVAQAIQQIVYLIELVYNKIKQIVYLMQLLYIKNINMNVIKYK